MARTRCDRLRRAVILDLMLPRLGGLDVYQELRAHSQTAHLPIIVITGAEISDLDSTSVRHFLRKPVGPEVLVATVERALRGSRSG